MMFEKQKILGRGAVLLFFVLLLFVAAPAHAYLDLAPRQIPVANNLPPAGLIRQIGVALDESHHLHLTPPNAEYAR